MHVGKRYPLTMINATWFIENTVWVLPRKIQIIGAPLGSSGSVAALWAGTTVVSGEAYRHATDPLKTSWDFENPTDPLATITFTARLQEQSPVPGGGWAYEYWWFAEAFYNAVHLADLQNETSDPQDWTPVYSGIPVAGTWAHRLNNALWLNLYTAIKSASWAQQPEYHPYRH